jgi:hypothetical protein
MRVVFWFKNLKGGDHSEVLNWTIILEWILGRCGGKMCTGFISFRIGISGGFL